MIPEVGNEYSPTGHHWACSGSAMFSSSANQWKSVAGLMRVGPFTIARRTRSWPGDLQLRSSGSLSRPHHRRTVRSKPGFQLFHYSAQLYGNFKSGHGWADTPVLSALQTSVNADRLNQAVDLAEWGDWIRSSTILPFRSVPPVSIGVTPGFVRVLTCRMYVLWSHHSESTRRCVWWRSSEFSGDVAALSVCVTF